MKTLYLIRHAKSDWYKGVEDFERPLNKRGLRDAPEMGKFLKSESISPGLIISSDANRAISTARLISKEIGYDLTKIVENHNLYHASPKGMVNEIWKVDNTIDTLFVFGHNPGISDLILYLTEDPAELKTCCVAKITFELDEWEALVRGTGTLENVISPKEL